MLGDKKDRDGDDEMSLRGSISGIDRWIIEWCSNLRENWPLGKVDVILRTKKQFDDLEDKFESALDDFTEVMVAHGFAEEVVDIPHDYDGFGEKDMRIIDRMFEVEMMRLGYATFYRYLGAVNLKSHGDMKMKLKDMGCTLDEINAKAEALRRKEGKSKKYE